MSKTVKKWSPEEDEILLQQVTLLSSQGKAKDWTAIASAVPGRSNKDCRKRWCNHLVGGLRKGPWDPSEDRRLAIGVKEYGVQWPLVAEEVGTRSADQCAKRWQHSLDPSLDRSKWTEEEEEKLLKAVEKHGRAWKLIQTEYFPGRATNNVKNKYVVLTRKRESPHSENEAQDGTISSGENVTRGTSIHTRGASSDTRKMSSDARGTSSDTCPTSSAKTTPPSPPPSTAANASPDVSTLILDDAMAKNNDYHAQQSGDPFSLDMYSHTIPTTMDLDMASTDALATDMSLDLGSSNLMAGLDETSTTGSMHESLFPSDTNRRFSTATQPEIHTGPHFDSDKDPQSMLWNMGFLQNQPAKLVLTIENPTQAVISGITGVLVPSKTKFRMEMQ
ncbi:hypothetical protein SLS57_011205 [Botryosphaeria dothidea]